MAMPCASLRRSFSHWPSSREPLAPLMIAHRLMGMSLLHTGEISKARAHFDRAIVLYNPSEHRPLATRFGHDVASVEFYVFDRARSWLLGLPDAAAQTIVDALKHARELGQAATLMYALTIISIYPFPLR